MATTIITKNGTGAPLASDLVAGELAVDLTNKRLYTEDSGGTIIEVGSNPSVLDVDNININGNAIISTDTNGNIDLTPNGTGEVNISKVDIDAGAIDGTAIGANSASTGAFTTLTASTSLNIASSTTVDGVLDEDTMSSDSATKLATQQSIKAYVDSQVGANNELSEVLANGNTTGSTNIVVTAGQSITTDSILETTAAAGVDIDGVLLKDTSVGTDDASGTDVAGTAVTVKGGAGTGTGAGGSLVFQTAPAGTTGSTPNAQVTALTIDSAGDATFTGASYNMSWDKSANSLAFADNAKAVFGAGSDLQIYHDSNNSYIKDADQGNLYILASELRIANSGNTKDFIHGNDGAEVKLFYNNAQKLATTSTGIDVTGDITLGDTNPTITFNDSSIASLSHTISSASDNLRIMADVNGVDAGSRVEIFDGTTEVARFEAGAVDITGTVTTDGLTVDTAIATSTASFRATTNSTTIGQKIGSLDFFNGTTNAAGTLEVRRASGGNAYSDMALMASANGNRSNQLLLSTNGDISFYEDTGTTAKLFWDASAESLGIGTSSPAQTLHLKSADPVIRLEDSSPDGVYAQIDGAGGGLILSADGGNGSASSFIGFRVDGTASGSEKMRIDSSGNVLVGTTSAYTGGKLSVNGSIAQPSGEQHVIGTYGTSGLQLIGTSGGDNIVGTMGGSEPLIFRTGSTERMRIDSSGNVGIGVTPATDWNTGYDALQIGQGAAIMSSSGTEELFLNMNAKWASDSSWEYIADGTAAVLSMDQATPFKFRYAAAGTANTDASLSEAMRIDSSGNLLVGQTSNSETGTGIGLVPDGTSHMYSGSTDTLMLGRGGTDGDILSFNKSGITVGTIGTNSGYLFIGSPVGTDAHLLIGNGLIHPATSTGATKDASIDIGGSTNRFKDLYLSGGIYVGGAVAANKLDDYEEGTFTPVVSDAATAGNTATYATNDGYYTKVGNLVQATIYLVNIDTTGMTGANNVYIQGLPFSQGSAIDIGSIRINSTTFSGSPVLQADSGYCVVQLSASGSAASYLTVAGLSSGAADIIATITYRTA